jgi:hypothetical protein
MPMKLWSSLVNYLKWIIATPDRFFTFLIGVILGVAICISFISNIWGGLFMILFAILTVIHTLNIWKIP